MRFDILTLFPDMCRATVDESILGRAGKIGLIEVFTHNIRDYTLDKHRRTDDAPYGGGLGLIMQVQPLADCLAAVLAEHEVKPPVIYLSPKGERFNQKKASEFSALPGLVLVCGHYEGVDQRFIDKYVDLELSIGDFVLTGGELPALTVVDAVSRLVPGVLKCEQCYEDESIQSGLLEYPHYTRPPVYEEMEVPEILLSGDHGKIAKWRREKSLKATLERRPEMLETANLNAEDKKIIEKLLGK